LFCSHIFRSAGDGERRLNRQYAKTPGEAYLWAAESSVFKVRGITARLLSTFGTVSLHRAATFSLCARTPYRVVEYGGFSTAKTRRARRKHMSLAPELTSFGSGLPSQAADERLLRGRWDLSPDWCCTDLCPREGTNVVRIVFHSCIRRPSRTTRLSFWRASLRGRYGVSVEFPLPSTYPSLV
jgi:hypothetical protein